jgi:hypothetical protein
VGALEHALGGGAALCRAALQGQRCCRGGGRGSGPLTGASASSSCSGPSACTSCPVATRDSRHCRTPTCTAASAQAVSRPHNAHCRGAAGAGARRAHQSDRPVVGRSAPRGRADVGVGARGCRAVFLELGQLDQG